MSDTTQQHIDVKRAISIAKTYVQDLFSEDHVNNIGLEEVEFDEAGDVWNITIGFSRPWDESRYSYMMADYPNDKGLIPRPHRDYKLLSISAKDGSVKRIGIRPI